MKVVVAVGLLLACVSAGAQVHRCIDAAGKASYSDTACPTSATRADQVLGRGATVSRPDPYAAERNLESIERARAIQQGTVESAVEQSRGSDGAVHLGSRTAAPSPAAAAARPDVEGCETYSTRKGCMGGERVRNPNWSPNEGYYGGGGPADQRREAQKQAAAQARAVARPTSFMNCDKAGCWSNTGSRYNFGAGGNLNGPSGRVCTRGVGNNFHCN